LVELKLVLSNPADGKSKTVTVADAQAQSFIGLRIKDEFNADAYGFPGQMAMITGGSDKSGIPLRGDIPGGAKRRILLAGPPGYKPKNDGERRRKLVRGSMITEDIVQINATLLKSEQAGKTS